VNPVVAWELKSVARAAYRQIDVVGIAGYLLWPGDAWWALGQAAGDVNVLKAGIAERVPTWIQ